MQFKLNESIKAFLFNDRTEIWNNILENNIYDLLHTLGSNNSGNTSNVVDNIISELFSSTQSHTLESIDLATIAEGNSTIVSDLVRLLMVIDINGKHEKLRQIIAEKLVKSMDLLVENIQKGKNGFTQGCSQNIILQEAFALRNSFNYLAYYYKEKDFFEAEIHIVTQRTQITLALLGQYRYLVGPDMIQSGKLMEQANDITTALAFYEAIKKDFADELTFFNEYPEQGANEDDRSILESLHAAYLSIDRINETNQYENVCAQIEEVLSREFVEVNFDDDDED